jgi:acyl-CoA hydrolase
MHNDFLTQFRILFRESVQQAYDYLSQVLDENDLIESKIEVPKKKKRPKFFEASSDMSLTYTRLVMPDDLNPSGTLFGGRMLEWIDHTGCIYLLKKYGIQKLITTEMQDVYFQSSPVLGDLVNFYVETLTERPASIWLRVLAMNETKPLHPIVIDCEIKFAIIDKIKKIVDKH